MDKRKAIRLLEPLVDKPPKASHGGGTFHSVHPTQLARLYCAVSEKDKALAMYRRAHHGGTHFCANDGGYAPFMHSSFTQFRDSR
ncbi:MAG: hypothetical protein V3W19_06450 [Desulfatiglandales bacterium]